MRIIDPAHLFAYLPDHGRTPRIATSGNHATPWRLLDAVDRVLPAYRLFMLGGQPGVPVRDGVEHETPFVGPGVRGLASLCYLPARLSLVPRILATTHVPDIVLLHVAPARNGFLSLGTEVNILPAAIEQCRAHGGLVIAQINPRMPYTFGDAEISADLVDIAVAAEEPLPTPQSATHRRIRRSSLRSASAWPGWSATARPFRPGSARCPTPCSRPCAATTACGSGPR